MTKTIKRYSELKHLQTFEERLEYLDLTGQVGKDTFGFDRYINQMFYRSAEWRHIRDIVIARDLGCDLGIEGFPIYDKILIHHMNPITVDDIKNQTDLLIDPEYLITVSHKTHNLIHYGRTTLARILEPKERTPNDTCPWKK